VNDELESSGRKRSWPKLRPYSGICLEGLTKTTKNSVMIAGLQAEILTWDVPNTRQSSIIISHFNTNGVIFNTSQDFLFSSREPVGF
jgi:hypothetical protein